jgi:DNA-binding transcriptional regulator YiaG
MSANRTLIFFGRCRRHGEFTLNLPYGDEYVGSVRCCQSRKSRLSADGPGAEIPARVHRIPVSAITEARTRSGLSQARFAQVLGVSTRTLQEWEQGRRQPSGAARALLTIAARMPEVLREVFVE